MFEKNLYEDNPRLWNRWEKTSETLNRNNRRNLKIADTLNFIALQGILRKNMIIASSPKASVEFWLTKLSNLEEEKQEDYILNY